MELLKSQKTILYDTIVDYGFAPSTFELDDFEEKKRAGKSTGIVHTDSDFHFVVWSAPAPSADYYYYYSPGESKLVDSSVTSGWGGVFFVFTRWLNLLRREIGVVDKWQQLQGEVPNFKMVETNNEGKFSYDEVLQIETRVHLLKTKIKEIPLSASQAKVLNEKLDYCIELAKTSNKFDWAGYFIGIITTIILTLAVTPENAKHIWEAIKEVFRGLLLI